PRPRLRDPRRREGPRPAHPGPPPDPQARKRAAGPHRAGHPRRDPGARGPRPRRPEVKAAAMRNYAPFLLVLLLIAIALRIDFFFTSAYFMAAIFLLSRLWIGRLARNLEVERQFTDHAFTREQVTVTLAIRTKGWLPVPWLEVAESLPLPLVSAPFQVQIAG